MAVAVGTFLLALALIATERLHRTVVALVGAAVVVAGQVISQEQAVEAIDFNTIGLLVGMMILVRVTEPTGVYNYLAIRAGQLARGSSFGVVVALAGTTAVLSALLDNLTTVLLVVPITFLLADTLDIEPFPLILIEIVASNIGGTATLIGDPPNILIAGATGLTFTEFFVNLAPVAVISFVVVTGVLYVVFRRRLRVPAEARTRVQDLDARRSIEEPAELRRTVPVLALTIVVFFFHQQLHVEPATVALTGASLSIVVTEEPIEKILEGVEWATLFFFVGLFVMVGALEETGAVAEVADGIATVTGGNRTAELLGILWASGFASGVVDNIPFTAAMIPVVEELHGGESGGDAYWWALALGACFGGNATLIAAAANVAAAGMAQRAGQPIGFKAFLKVGIPATVISLTIATGYVLVRYA